MWWNDLKALKNGMIILEKDIHRIEGKLDSVRNFLEEIFCSEEEASPITRIHDKLDDIIGDIEELREVTLSESTLNKFDDYMKNVDKLNAIVNEIKGCASMARASMKKPKK